MAQGAGASSWCRHYGREMFPLKLDLATCGGGRRMKLSNKLQMTGQDT